MDWTRETPGEPGWYWYAVNSNDVPRPAQVWEPFGRNSPLVARVDGNTYEADRLTGYWLGPLELPAPPQDATS